MAVAVQRAARKKVTGSDRACKVMAPSGWRWVWLVDVKRHPGAFVAGVIALGPTWRRPCTVCCLPRLDRQRRSELSAGDALARRPLFVSLRRSSRCNFVIFVPSELLNERSRRSGVAASARKWSLLLVGRFARSSTSAGYGRSLRERAQPPQRVFGERLNEVRRAGVAGQCRRLPGEQRRHLPVSGLAERQCQAELHRDR